MVHRKIIPLIAGSALLLPALLGGFRTAHGRPPAADPSGVEAAAPARNDAEMVLVEWVIRTEDLVACETATPELRRVRHQYGDRVRLVAYAVDTDVRLVQSFLRRERLGRVDLQPRTERAFQADHARRFGSAASAPALLVVSRGAEAQAFDATVRTARGRRGMADFATYLDGVLARATLAEAAPAPSTGRGEE